MCSAAHGFEASSS